MKSFFKKHPELLFLIVGVIIVDCVIMWMWVDGTSVTDRSRKEIEVLREQAVKINKSPYAITDSNAVTAQKESEKWKAELDAVYLEKSRGFTLKTEYQENMLPAKAKKIIKDKVNLLIDETLAEKNKTSNRLSFGQYDNMQLFDLSSGERKVVFEILAATEKLVQICVEADVISLDSIERPTALKYVDDPKLKLRSYRFILKTTNSAEGIKRLMNKIALEKEFYFEINGFSLKAEEQLNVSSQDIRPKVERKSQAKPKEDEDAGGLGRLRNELRGLSAPRGNVGAKVLEDSVAPFSDAIVRLELTIDWVQYIKELKK